jgi:hypothetical protein
MLYETSPTSGTVDRSAQLTSVELLRGRFPELFVQYPVDDYIRLLDDTQQGKSMFHVPESVAVFRKGVIRRWGVEGLEVYHRVTMLTLMDAFEERARQFNYPPSILLQFRINFARIRNHITRGKTGTYDHADDNFIKDFAICRQTAFPAGGCWVIDHHGSVPRRVLFAGGVAQFFQFAWLYLFVIRGHRSLYTPHIHDDLVAMHTPEQGRAYRLRVAEMLQRHPEIKGLAGDSWLNDPVVAGISPKLRWLREIPSSNGARYFRVCEDIHGGALTRSPTRQRLYREGNYVPTRYLYIWPRNRLINWASRARVSEAHSPITRLGRTQPSAR